MTTCLVLGGAACLQADIDAHTGPIDAVVACNDAGTIWPGELDAWVSIHANYFHKKGWLSQRAANGFAPARGYFTNREKFAEDFRRDVALPITVTDWWFPGQACIEDGATITSGFLAAKVALVDLGFDRVVLCGIPLTRQPHFFDKEAWGHAEKYAKRLPNIPDEYRARIRSMSGATREHFGAPE